MYHPLPRIEIDLAKLTANARLVVDMCRACGISVLGVTKACAGSLQVAQAMLTGGVEMVADSRLENLARLRSSGISPLLQLRLPMISRVDECVAIADISLNSEPTVIAALGEAAHRLGRAHGVVLMVDLGDRREGVAPDDAVELALQAAETRGIEFLGFGTNLTCFGGIIPTRRNLGQLVEIAERFRARSGHPVQVVSGGNSSSLPLVMEGEVPAGVNQLRVGEGILLGRETIRRSVLPGAYQDVFSLVGEVIECLEKPSLPCGEVGEDAFGCVPEFSDRGHRWRAIVALGRQDVLVEGLEPADPGMEILGASSDHLIIDVTEAEQRPHVGEEVRLRIVDYAALLTAMTSPYVTKCYVGEETGYRLDLWSRLPEVSVFEHRDRGPDAASADYRA